MNLKYLKNPYMLFFVIILIASASFTLFSADKQDTLDVYNQSDILSTTEITTKAPKIESFSYEDEAHHFKLKIPEGWEKVTQNGYDTFIHTPSASSVQIQIAQYDPAINQTSLESASARIVENGFSFIHFTRLSSSSYEILYQDLKMNAYDYIEEVYWNQDYIVTLVCIFNDTNYDKMISYFEYILRTFQWTGETIPEQYTLFYSAIGDFEFGVPTDWAVSDADGTIVAINSDRSAQMLVTVQESSDNLNNFTATDMTHLIASGKSGFMLKEFETSTASASAKAAYYDNTGENIINQTYLFASGFFLYTIQFDYYAGAIDESIPDTSIHLYREFITKKVLKNETDSEDLPSGESLPAINTPE